MKTKKGENIMKKRKKEGGLPKTSFVLLPEIGLEDSSMVISNEHEVFKGSRFAEIPINIWYMLLY